MRTVSIACTLCFLSLAGCVREPVVAPVPEFVSTDVPAALGRRAVPIGGSLSGLVTPTVLPSGLFRWEVAAAGNTSHLGRATAAIVFPEVEVDVPSLRLIVRSGTWSGVMTAANGDQLFGRYTIRNDSTTLDLLGNVRFIADLEITGGTGRFDGASGTGLTVGEGNLFQLTFSTTVQGAISRAS